MPSTPSLFSPIRVGALELPNRVVMAPMARARSDDNRAPTPMVAEYYAQRASAGLIVTEASSVSPLSQSRPHASAIYLPLHVQGWARVADAVHAAGGRIFQQIYHLGRKSDPSRMPGGAPPVAPSAIAARGQVAGVSGPVDFAVPRALETGEIAGVVAEFRNAAANAKAAGMDGVEIHGANGYLIDEFLRDGTNRRTDRYGGGPENRVRFLLEIVDAVASVFRPGIFGAGVSGAGRVGVRLSPHHRGDGIFDSDPAEIFGHAAAQLSARGIAYLHLIEAAVPGLPQSPAPGAPAQFPEERGAPAVLATVRRAFPGPLIVNGGYTRASAEAVIASGQADLVAFATLYIANPDLVERLRRDGPFNTPDPATFHTGGAKGYVDYPRLGEGAGIGAE